MRNIGFALLCAAASVSAVNAQTAYKVSIGDTQNYGLTYTLPQTDICVTARAVATKTVAGIYAPFAEKFLGLADVATSDQTTWELTSITLEAEAKPDTSRTFHIDFAEKATVPQFYVSESGTLLSINRQPETAAAPTSAKQEEAEQEEPKKLTLKPTDVLTEEILKAASKVKQAELTAREIFSIRESRRDLLKGDVENMPKDGASMQIVLDNLDAQEQALLSLFVGTSTTFSAEKKYHYIPTENIQNKVMFRFSSYFGLVEEDDLVGEPYYVSVKISEDNRMNAAPSDPKKKGMGIAYNVPGKATIALSYEGETLIEENLIMGQFGHVEQLPVSYFIDKKAPASATFHQLSGSLKTYEK